MLLKTVRLDSANLLANEFANHIAHEYILEFRGVNAAAQTLALADLGKLQISAPGLDGVGMFWNQNISDLAVENNMYGGVIRNESAVGAAFNIAVKIPLYLLPFDQNALHVNRSWNLSIEIVNFNNAKVASGSLYISNVEAFYEQKYIPYKYSSDRTVTNGDNDIYQLKYQNMNKVILFKNTATLGQLIVTRDGRKIISDDFTSLETKTNLGLNLETFVSNYAVIDMNPSNEKFERMGDSADVSAIITGTGSYRVIVSGTIETTLTNELLKQSKATIRDYILDQGRRAKARQDVGALKSLADSLGKSTDEFLKLI